MLLPEWVLVLLFVVEVFPPLEPPAPPLPAVVDEPVTLPPPLPPAPVEPELPEPVFAEPVVLPLEWSEPWPQLPEPWLCFPAPEPELLP